MKKIEILKVEQRKDSFYIGKADPRVLIHLADDIQIGEVQDAQRPLEKRHLEDIAQYVGEEDGILPTSVLISTKNGNEKGKSITVKSEDVTITNSDGVSSNSIRYYLELPENDSEFENYKGTIDIIDGQHRLFSFREGVRSPELKDADIYEMTFSLFITPKIKERQKLFMVTNEKQKAVSGNLLLWLREKLGLLGDTEKRFYGIVSSLNTEECSPLKGRIIQSAEKIPKGYKAKELIKILNKAFPENNVIINQPLNDDDKKVDAICKYLHGWEEYYEVSYQRPEKGTITKISGLRYILWWFPTIWEQAVNEHRSLNDEFIKEIIDEIQKSIGEDNNIFEISANFRGEGATDKAVKDHINIWKAYHAQKNQQMFNPLG